MRKCISGTPLEASRGKFGGTLPYNIYNSFLDFYVRLCMFW